MNAIVFTFFRYYLLVMKNNRQYKLNERLTNSSNFSLEELHSLTSYAKMMNYCKDRLEYIGAGTARIVFLLDENKVLKLAKNKKGLAQNEAEWDMRNESSFTPEMYDVDDNDLWIIAQKAEKLTKKIFQEIEGYSIEALASYVWNAVTKYNRSIDPEENQNISDNSEALAHEIVNLHMGYDLPFQDLVKKTNLGWVMDDDGERRVVIIDIGLNDDVYKQHYQNENKINENMKKVTLTKTELESLVENIILQRAGKLSHSKAIKSTLSESVDKSKRQVIKMNESDLNNLVNSTIKSLKKG